MKKIFLLLLLIPLFCFGVIKSNWFYEDSLEMWDPPIMLINTIMYDTVYVSNSKWLAHYLEADSINATKYKNIIDSLKYDNDTIYIFSGETFKLEIPRVGYSDSSGISVDAYYADSSGTTDWDTLSDYVLTFALDYTDSIDVDGWNFFNKEAELTNLLDDNYNWFDNDSIIWDTLGAYLDTNTVIRDSVHAYQEATDSITTPKAKIGVGTGQLAISSWASNIASWINLPTTGPSGIGSGGVGQEAWIAYVKAADQWVYGSVEGDIVYRNRAGKLLFGTASNQIPGITISANKIGINDVTPNARLDVNGDCIIEDSLVVNGLLKPQILDLHEGYHLGGDSIVIVTDTLPTPNTGWTFIDTSGGDTMKCFLNSVWEVK